RDRLDALDSVPGNVVFSETGGVIRFDVQVLTSLEGQAQLGIGDVNNVDMNVTADVTADVAMHLVFGLDSRGFFIDADGNGDPEFTINNLRITGDVAGVGRIGFAAVQVTAGTLVMDPSARMTIDLLEPGADPVTGQTDGLIRLYELNADPALLTAVTIQHGTG